MEELLSKHRKEKKDLQARITQKKKAASKKTRKGVNDECDRLEAELKERHATEVAGLDPTSMKTENAGDDEEETLIGDAEATEDKPKDSADETAAISSQVADLNLSEDQHVEKKPNRQKARMARKAAEQTRLAEEAEAEAAAMPDLRTRERDIMAETFTKHGLQEKEIRADGHCLYSAFADQLKLQNRKLHAGKVIPQRDEFRTIRYVAADYIEDHSDDFVPFMEEDLQTYTKKVRDTGEWGGQIELQALAKVYQTKICVVQGGGQVTEIGDGEDDKAIWLAYYRHGFGLGEHYNSLRKQAPA
jgi:OTU domain-containing protein 6